ncbi:MAG: ribosome-associated translation inhibitor RaiA [Anaerolineaceae bacterium]|jgi:putative sigma-54 modulation protein|nr:MAG: ribosome-associated translation inhibitor RaiA [Anaerolineaceae bacterium]
MSEKIEIFVKNITLTEDLQNYVNKKTIKLDKYLKSIEEIRVDLSYVKTARETTNRFIAQITLRGKGFILRAEERAEEITTAIDKVMDKIQRQIERYKGKKYLKRPENQAMTDLVEEVSSEPAEEGRGIIARRKTFTLIPMDELEAIEQMTLLGHEDFFIFYNVKTNKINVLYKRRDGTYGLIDPVIG